MTTISSKYIGNLKAETLISEGHTWITHSPEFGPTDLLTASLGHCIITYVDYVCKKKTFTIEGTKIKIVKTLSADENKITSFLITLFFPVSYSVEQKSTIESAAKRCPVGNSLHPDILKKFQFNYEI